VIDADAAFLHHFLQIAIADAVFAGPSDAMQDDLSGKMPPLEIVHAHNRKP
jgi:hypothetical protein